MEWECLDRFSLAAEHVVDAKRHPYIHRPSTDTGDLSVIFKFLLLKDQGDVLSAGMVVTAPAGPSAFAGDSVFAVPHTTVLQPFVGYRKTSTTGSSTASRPSTCLATARM